MSLRSQVPPLVILMASLFGCGSVTPAGENDASPIDSSISDAPICPKSPCDLYEQCGCAEPQVCDLDLGNLPSGETDCRDVEASGTELDRCTRLEECAGGFLCGNGQCLLHCQDDEDCVAGLGQGAVCIRTINDGEGGDVPGVRACSKPCTPEGLNNNNNCPVDFACRILGANVDQPDAFTYSDCVVGGPGGNDADCSANGNAQCQPGFICINFSVNDGGGSRCRQICPAGGANNCNVAGQVCREFTTPPELDGVEYGFCGVTPTLATATSDPVTTLGPATLFPPNP